MKDEPAFDHEKLDAYRLSIEFQAWVGERLDEGFSARPNWVAGRLAIRLARSTGSSLSQSLRSGSGQSPSGNLAHPLAP